MSCKVRLAASSCTQPVVVLGLNTLSRASATVTVCNKPLSDRVPVNVGLTLGSLFVLIGVTSHRTNPLRQEAEVLTAYPRLRQR